MKSEKKYRGVVVPAVTPVTHDFQLDELAVEKMFSNFRRHNVHPFILGTTGEASSASSAIKHRYLQVAGKLKQPGEQLYAGVSGNCVEDSIDLARRAFDAGVDVVAATLPSYYSLTSDEMLRYFEQLADAIGGPLIVYNIPATTHMSIPLELIDKLSHHENIVGTKDSERSEERLQSSLKLWSKRSDFSYFIGWAARSAETLIGGGDGLIPSTGNFAPSLYSAMMSAASSVSNNGAKTDDHKNLDNSEPEIFRLQRLSDKLGNIYQSGRSLGQSLWALKVLMKEADLCEPLVLPPLLPQGEEQRKVILDALRDFQEKEENIYP